MLMHARVCLSILKHACVGNTDVNVKVNTDVKYNADYNVNVCVNVNVNVDVYKRHIYTYTHKIFYTAL